MFKSKEKQIRKFKDFQNQLKKNKRTENSKKLLSQEMAQNSLVGYKS